MIWNKNVVVKVRAYCTTKFGLIGGAGEGVNISYPPSLYIDTDIYEIG